MCISDAHGVSRTITLATLFGLSVARRAPDSPTASGTQHVDAPSVARLAASAATAGATGTQSLINPDALPAR